MPRTVKDKGKQRKHWKKLCTTSDAIPSFLPLLFVQVVKENVMREAWGGGVAVEHIRHTHISPRGTSGMTNFFSTVQHSKLK